MNIFFLIPFFNEEENVSELFNNLSNVAVNYKKVYVFVDDCSSDNSIKLIEKLFRETDFYLIRKEKNKGPGDSFNIGFEWILSKSDSDDDLVITMEADNTCDYNLVQTMIEISKLGYDLLLASPYAQGGGFERTNLIRKILSFFVNIFFRAFFNIKVLTLSSFFRAYKISLLKKIKSRFTVIINEKGFISMLEILLKSIRLNSKIIEIPMVLKSNNRADKSKMKIFKTGLEYIRFLFFSKF